MIGDFGLLFSEMNRTNTDAFVITSPENTFYVSSYYNPDSVIVIKNRNIYYLTDSRYTTEAKRFLNQKIRLMDVGKNVAKALFDLLNDCDRIGFETGIKYGEYIDYFQNGLMSKAIPVSDFLKAGRSIKNVAEKALIAHAARINDLTYEKIIDSIHEGMTERELRDIAEWSFRSLGADGLAFDTIVAFGENAAEPHHQISDRRLRYGDCILVDMGCKLKGYCSDVTRTFFFGEVDNRKKMLYNKVLDCNRQGVDLLKDGVESVYVNNEIRNSFRRDGLDQYFTHSLGHGVGIDIHEEPFLSSHGSGELNIGNVVTIEPGLYFPGDFGVRIEDLLYVGEDGAEELSHFDRQLIEL